MKLLRELLIILTIYFCGEFLSSNFNLPIPGNILGMIILLILLITKTIKIERIETVSNFFLDHLAFFFIPAGVGLLTSISFIKDIWIQFLLICLISTIVVIASTGLIVEKIIKKNKNKDVN